MEFHRHRLLHQLYFSREDTKTILCTKSNIAISASIDDNKVLKELMQFATEEVVVGAKTIPIRVHSSQTMPWIESADVFSAIVMVAKFNKDSPDVQDIMLCVSCMLSVIIAAAIAFVLNRPKVQPT